MSQMVAEQAIAAYKLHLKAQNALHQTHEVLYSYVERGYASCPEPHSSSKDKGGQAFLLRLCHCSAVASICPFDMSKPDTYLAANKMLHAASR